MNRRLPIIPALEQEPFRSRFGNVADPRDLAGAFAEPRTLLLQLFQRLALGCAIWTEDTDFFGCGVATWTTDRVELYLAKASEREE